MICSEITAFESSISINSCWIKPHPSYLVTPRVICCQIKELTQTGLDSLSNLECVKSVEPSTKAKTKTGFEMKFIQNHLNESLLRMRFVPL